MLGFCATVVKPRGWISFELADGTLTRAKAKRDFPTLWKDADIPVLKEAKAEYAKFQ
jgi:hypothetical protein